MRARTTESSVPTEPTLGSWSLTALAVLLVIGGILGLFSSSHPSNAYEHGQTAMHPAGRAEPAK